MELNIHTAFVLFICCLIQDESFLEDVNMILNTGDIPNLYDNEERLEIIEKVHCCSTSKYYQCFIPKKPVDSKLFFIFHTVFFICYQLLVSAQ